MVMDTAGSDWSQQLYETLKSQGITQVSMVPDAGHANLIRLCEADSEMKLVRLTTEEEGVALAVGAWLGGDKSVLLMQSSGVGNCVNMLSMLSVCQVPLPMLITMRGDWAEFNPWQVPMGRATPAVLAAMDVAVHGAGDAAEVAPTVDAALRLAYSSYAAVAVLISQQVIGIKSFQEQAEK